LRGTGKKEIAAAIQQRIVEDVGLERVTILSISAAEPERCYALPRRSGCAARWGCWRPKKKLRW